MDRLRQLHYQLSGRLQDGDRLVYLGNYIGYGPDIVGTVDELLTFRRAFLARAPFIHTGDLVFLRGSQEEMWHRVLQLQFAVDPVEVMSWMGERGLAATLTAYAGDTSADIMGHRAWPLTIAQWTGSVRAVMQKRLGHVAFMSALKRAAYTAEESLPFVNAGIDTDKPVEEQSDVFCVGRAIDLRKSTSLTAKLPGSSEVTTLITVGSMRTIIRLRSMVVAVWGGET